MAEELGLVVQPEGLFKRTEITFFLADSQFKMLFETDFEWSHQKQVEFINFL